MTNQSNEYGVTAPPWCKGSMRPPVPGRTSTDMHGDWGLCARCRRIQRLGTRGAMKMHRDQRSRPASTGGQNDA
jgi:hypothetical protein